MVYDPKIIEQLTDFAFKEKKKGTDNSEIRKRLHHKGLTKEQIRDVMNASDDRLYASFEKKKSKRGFLGLSKKAKAYILIVIGSYFLITRFTGSNHSSHWLWFLPIMAGLGILAEGRRDKYHEKFKTPYSAWYKDQEGKR